MLVEGGRDQLRTCTAMLVANRFTYERARGSTGDEGEIRSRIRRRARLVLAQPRTMWRHRDRSVSVANTPSFRQRKLNPSTIGGASSARRRIGFRLTPTQTLCPLGHPDHLRTGRHSSPPHRPQGACTAPRPIAFFLLLSAPRSEPCPAHLRYSPTPAAPRRTR